MPSNEYIEIGKIVNTFGIKGELKVASESDFIDYRYQVGKIIYLYTLRKYLPYKVTSKRMVKNSILITVNDLYDINQVEALVGTNIYALKSDVPPLKENEYLMDDLVGLDVYLTTGELFGRVNDFIITNSGKILEIKTNNDVKLIPFVKDFVKQVEKDKIIIRPYEEV